jgi:hypothetical protein
MLSDATTNGSVEVCHLAKEWGATNFDDMLNAAVFAGHDHIYHLVKEWGTSEPITED